MILPFVPLCLNDESKHGLMVPVATQRAIVDFVDGQRSASAGVNGKAWGLVAWWQSQQACCGPANARTDRDSHAAAYKRLQELGLICLESNLRENLKTSDRSVV